MAVQSVLGARRRVFTEAPQAELGAGVHGSTPSEAGAGVFILADTPKIAKSKTGVENYGSVSMGRYQGSVSRGLPPMGHS